MNSLLIDPSNHRILEQRLQPPEEYSRLIDETLPDRQLNPLLFRIFSEGILCGMLISLDSTSPAKFWLKGSLATVEGVQEFSGPSLILGLNAEGERVTLRREDFSIAWFAPKQTSTLAVDGPISQMVGEFYRPDIVEQLMKDLKDKSSW